MVGYVHSQRIRSTQNPATYDESRHGGLLGRQDNGSWAVLCVRYVGQVIEAMEKKDLSPAYRWVEVGQDRTHMDTCIFTFLKPHSTFLKAF